MSNKTSPVSFGVGNLKAEILSNHPLYLFLYTQIMNAALKVFEWRNLPEEIESDFIEWALFNFGQCVYGKGRGAKYNGLYIALPAAGTYEYNIYGRPVKWRAQGLNYSEAYSALDSVLICNTYLRTPSATLIAEYVQRMTDILLAMDVNINTSKTPFAFYGDDKSIKTLRSVMNDNQRNSYLLTIDKSSIGINGLEKIDLNVEYKADKFWSQFCNIKSLIYEMLGINTLNTEKKERLITDEANSNNEQIDFNVGALLLERQKAAEKINEMFKTNISVDLRYKTQVEEPTNNIDYDYKGGEY